ncbi:MULTISPECIES: hypothetical protein [Methylobacteriaceae]|uniref:hypothetical protein n=1 Tax=Methylobacteriaceae TaxID=119045 RepID=UPI000CDA8B01|nr:MULTISPECIES: hypothetical protein [Methylobacteriaceae]MCP1549393.1 hypothetical protein [Methylorubrum zatmanii]MCP1553994.1 hypothetical protein [Methylorubrum extorquens]MCP1579695.1 hypothetical protein [Methylorubrum extorquens]POR41047.1 hypothetical protein CRT23_20650 [Methylobacterium sp. V23]
MRAEGIKLVQRKVGTEFVITSPDVPELHVSHPDPDRALAGVPDALDMIERMKDRRASMRVVKERLAHC